MPWVKRNNGTAQVEDLSINDLAELFAQIVGWKGEFVFNTEMPYGTPRKLQCRSFD